MEAQDNLFRLWCDDSRSPVDLRDENVSGALGQALNGVDDLLLDFTSR